ncbi:hypothetical protein BJ875DRAFT_438171 [Amylocarpus encephaloides]|uniref:Uncharacterized protein n=1 Tax=Amylocarpus encephaloides TaxID=45428 RepID=A0A9P7YQ51_9HELO|nr:hypothetical protein BJ875DRAFT_438171 [Amylocarpus encephaloides]
MRLSTLEVPVLDRGTVNQSGTNFIVVLSNSFSKRKCQHPALQRDATQRNAMSGLQIKDQTTHEYEAKVLYNEGSRNGKERAQHSASGPKGGSVAEKPHTNACIQTQPAPVPGKVPDTPIQRRVSHNPVTGHTNTHTPSFGIKYQGCDLYGAHQLFLVMRHNCAHELAFGYKQFFQHPSQGCFNQQLRMAQRIPLSSYSHYCV